MIFTQTPISGAYLIELEKHGDGRGFFARAFCADEFRQHGLFADFVQVNNTDQLALKYNASNEIGEIGSEAQCTALLEASADAALIDPLNLAGFVPEANKAIDLDNNGAAEYTTGDGTLSIRVWFIEIPMAAFT